MNKTTIYLFLLLIFLSCQNPSGNKTWDPYPFQNIFMYIENKSKDYCDSISNSSNWFYNKNDTLVIIEQHIYDTACINKISLSYEAQGDTIWISANPSCYSNFLRGYSLTYQQVFYGDTVRLVYLTHDTTLVFDNSVPVFPCK